MHETDDTTTPFVSASSQAAARLLEMAATNADQLVADATLESEQLLAAARDEAQQVDDDAQLARTEQAADLEKTRVAALADLVEEKARLTTTVERLRETERDYVARMRTYLTEELAHLDRLAPAPDVSTVADSAA
ncbi:hypothetical protein BH10ACT10_BH10ACT10_17540 [soil metagenome]